jgi:hypothetical protein
MTREQLADAEREAFEAWARLPGKARIDLHRFHGGEYHSQSTQDAWLAWQARAARTPSIPALAEKVAGEIAAFLESGVTREKGSHGVDTIGPVTRTEIASLITRAFQGVGVGVTDIKSAIFAVMQANEVGCGDSVCKFPDGCGCADDLAAAVASLRARLSSGREG